MSQQQFQQKTNLPQWAAIKSDPEGIKTEPNQEFNGTIDVKSENVDDRLIDDRPPGLEIFAGNGLISCHTYINIPFAPGI